MIKRLLQLIVFISLLLGISGIILGLSFVQFLHTPLTVTENGTVFIIAPRTSQQRIATQLKEANILQHPIWFLFCIAFEGAWNKLKAGEYLIEPGSLPAELVQKLQDGKVIQHAFTIVPGWTFTQLRQEMNQSPFLQHTLMDATDADIMIKLGQPGVHPEGQFLPETYYFPLGTTDIAFLQRANHQLQEKLTALWQAPRTLDAFPLKSPYEALILASIIEKETAVSTEYMDIAGVYIRRLLKDMPLQADPTVIYGVGKNYVGRLTASMLLEPNPYNTYQKLGLPPTPIALPSQKALEAALHPRPGDTLYFVANPAGNGHVFSKTLDEHNKAVAEYRKAQAGLN